MQALILILIVSLFFGGIVIRTKSICAGRKGPGIFQPLKDIGRLFRKGAIFSDTATVLTRIAPSIYFASVLLAVGCIPFGNDKGLFSFQGDFVFFAYVLALGKFFMIIAALDTGSSFEGMGASREAHFSMLAEPAFFGMIGSLALFTGRTSFQDIFTCLHFGNYLSYVLGSIMLIILVMLMLIENSRMPVDDPNTHLELTMVHEVMVLDYSGFDLGLIQYTTNLKFAMYSALIANLFTGTLKVLPEILIFLGTGFIMAIIVGGVESFTARLRMSRIPQFIFSLTSYVLLLFLLVLFITGRFS